MGTKKPMRHNSTLCSGMLDGVLSLADQRGYEKRTMHEYLRHLLPLIIQVSGTLTHGLGLPGRGGEPGGGGRPPRRRHLGQEEEDQNQEDSWATAAREGATTTTTEPSQGWSNQGQGEAAAKAHQVEHTAHLNAGKVHVMLHRPRLLRKDQTPNVCEMHPSVRDQHVLHYMVGHGYLESGTSIGWLDGESGGTGQHTGSHIKHVHCSSLSRDRVCILM